MFPLNLGAQVAQQTTGLCREKAKVKSQKENPKVNALFLLFNFYFLIYFNQILPAETLIIQQSQLIV